MAVYNPGMLVQARCRLWRVDSQQDSALFLTAVDEPTLQTHLYRPLEPVQSGKLRSPKPDILCMPHAQDLMLNVFHLSMMHMTAAVIAALARLTGRVQPPPLLQQRQARYGL